MVCRCTAFSYLEGDPELAYFAVYDGHGGTGVANYLKDHLHEFILDHPEYKKGNMEEAVYKAFLKVSTRLVHKIPISTIEYLLLNRRNFLFNILFSLIFYVHEKNLIFFIQTL